LGSPGPYPTGVEGVDGVEGDVLSGINELDLGTNKPASLSDATIKGLTLTTGNLGKGIGN